MEEHVPWIPHEGADGQIHMTADEVLRAALRRNALGPPLEKPPTPETSLSPTTDITPTYPSPEDTLGL